MATATSCQICHLDGRIKDAEYYCKQCRDHLCGECEAKHRAQSSYQNHPVLPFAPIMDIGMTCFTHKQEAATVWCETCSGAICLGCDVGKHDKHKTRDLHVHLSDWVSEIQSLGQNIEPLKQNIELSKTSIDGRIKELRDALETTEKEITKHYNKIMETITNKKEELISKLKETIGSRIQNLLNDLQLENNKIQQIRKWTEMKDGSLSGKEIGDLKNILSEGHAIVATKPEIVQCGEDLHFARHDSIELGRLVDNLPVWETRIRGRRVSDVSFTSQTTFLVAHGKQGGASLYKTQCDSVTFLFQSLILQEHNVKCIAPHKDIFYFTCRHQNCNTVHKCQIMTHQLTSAGQWSRNLFSSPAGIAVTDTGKVVVSDKGRKQVSIHKSNGERLITIGDQTAGRNTNIDIRFISPFHIATSKNNIFVSDHNGVFMIDLQGQLLRQIASDGEHKPPLWGMCFTDSGNLLMADMNNDQISQYDSSGTFMSHVITKQTANIGKPRFISFLKRGNLCFLLLYDEIDKKHFLKLLII